jgi:hypothetical protein
MSEIGITVGLVIALVVAGLLIYRVVRTLPAGSESSARADANAAGALPGSENIDTEKVRVASRPNELNR